VRSRSVLREAGLELYWSDGDAKKMAGMNLFKTFTLKWWQTALFKWGLLALGIAIGTCWHDFFGGYLLFLLIFSAISLAYITYAWWRQ
jgi:hypothetical protein